MLLRALPIVPAISAHAFASFTSNLDSRQDIDKMPHCGQSDVVREGPYTLFTDQSGANDVTSGSQCAQVSAMNGTAISWSTNWTWDGGDGVKSFASIGLDAVVGRQIKGITNLATSWDWTYDIANASLANVAYDVLISSSPDGNVTNEVMVWLASFNVQPPSSILSDQGEAVPAVTNIHLIGESWNLFEASNGSTSVSTFLPTNGTIQHFQSDLNAFIKFLILNVGLPQSQFITSARAGTQVISGSGTFNVSAYSLTVV